ncbi:MAG TPA: ABC transporter substrate-binding protein [Longimicrobium sp.]|jgi:peptide/nickel transport system substrate-binding protein
MPNARRGAPLAVIPVLLLLLAACGEPPGEKEDARRAAPGGGQPEPGGTAVTAELHDLEAPMPVVYRSEMDGDLVDVMYMGLTRGAWRDGRLVFLTSIESPMALAWHWEYAREYPDSSALRYRMKSGLRWSDGKPITAHDVVWTFRAMKDQRAASPRQEDLAALDSVVAENDSTVLFRFRRRTPEMHFVSSFPVAPRHAYEGAGPAGLATHPAFSRPETLVVSGPFRVGQWVPDQQIVLERNPHFPVRPHLDRLVIRVIPDATTRLVELQTGNVDMVKQIAFDAIPGLRRRAPNLRFAPIEKRYWEYLAYNPRRGPPFDDPEVRRALGMAVDVPGAVRALGMEGFAVPAAGPYPPIFRDLYDPRAMRPLPFDPEGARRTLERRGWTDADGDSVREKDGRRLRFTLLFNTGNQRRADFAQVLQRQWRAVGVDLRLQQLEFNTYQTRQINREFEVLLGSWAVNLSPDLSALFTPGSPFNIVSYADTAAARLMEAARAAPTAREANPLWRRAAEEVVRDQPYTWLYHYDIVVGLAPRLKGVRVDTFGAYQNTWEWWIPRAEQRGPAAGAAPADTPADTARR